MPSRIDNYTCIKTLGAGISAKVKLAQDAHGNRVALKIFDKGDPRNSSKAMETLKHEVDVYKACDHPYMVRLFEFKENAIMHKSDGSQKNVAYMALELISGGELFDYVALQPFNVPTCRYYFTQMLQVMHFMHSKGISHRDLKPENIMLDDKFNIRFADFGFAAPMQGRDGSGFLRTILGTTAYMAPELITKQPYQGHCVDLFALGIILFILYSGHPPFNSANPNDPHYKLLAEGKADLFWGQHSRNKKPGFFSEEFKDMITNMLQYNPTARLSLADLAGHPWMQGQIASADQVRTEFHQRQRSIKQQQAKEAAAKAQATPKTGTGKRANVVRGDDLLKDDFVADPNLPVLNSFKKENVFAVDNCFYSDAAPEELMSAVENVLKDKDIKYERPEKKFKLKYQIAQEQTDEEKEANYPIKGVVVQLKVTEINEHEVAVEFSKVIGDHFMFREEVTNMRSRLHDFNNVVVDKELLQEDPQVDGQI